VAPANREYLVYADGSCIGNPGPGGWGVVVRDPDEVVTELNGHDPSTTNNRMELMGAIEGLRATERGAPVVLRSDSRYVVNTMTLGWKRKANHDLWLLLDAETAARRVKFEWVRGHNTDPINNLADELALMGARCRLLAARVL
jgi:ribonuclease HI